MAEDRVTITADATQYFDVLSRAGVAGNRFARTGDEIGAGFIRGDRIVRTATQNITQGLLSANSAADAALITFQSLERVFKIGLLPTIGIAAGIAAIGAIAREIKKTEEAAQALRAELHHPLSAEIQLDPADIVSRIEAVTKATAELQRRQQSFINQALLGPQPDKLPSHLGGTLLGTNTPDPLLKEIAAGEQRISDLATARADKELKISQLKHIELTDSKEEAQIARAQLDFDTARAKLIDEFAAKGGNVLDFYKRALAAQFTLNDAIAKGSKALGDMAEAAALKLGKVVGDFFKDVGSGKFLKDLDQKRLEQQQNHRGKDIIAELRDAQQRGIPLGPNAQAILNEADNISKSAGIGIDDLSQLDFTNLEELTKYDFSGLDALDGLQISIQ